MAPIKKKKMVDLAKKPAKKVAQPEGVIRSRAPAPKEVTKKEGSSKSSSSSIEVIPKVLTGEGWRRRHLAALKKAKAK